MNRTSVLGAGAALLLGAAPVFAQSTQVEPTATSNRPINLDAPSGLSAVALRQSGTPSAFDGISAGELIGESIYNRGGESLGTIEDIVVNRDDNRIAALVGMGGFLGVSEKLVTVLLSELEMEGDNIIVRNLTSTDFRQKPAYQTNDWARHDRDRLIGSTTLR